MKNENDASRREFLKTCVAGMVALGADEALAFAASGQRASGKSKVVIATDANLRAQSGVDPKRMAALLDRAMDSFFGTHNSSEAWKRVVHPGQTVGLKVNTIAGPGLSTNRTLVEL